MNAFSEVIKAVEAAKTIDELDGCYVAAMAIIKGYDKFGLWNGVAEPDRMIATLNHLVIYHIVRIAGDAYDRYKESGRTDTSCIEEIRKCKIVMSKHADNEIEKSLVNNLCENLNID